MIPRGQRNNNPFNIKDTTIDWKGETGHDFDPTFEEFISMEMGVRAGMLLLRNYLRKGKNTIGAIITRFAPSSENNTVSYIDYVCSNTKIPHDAIIIERSDNFFKVCKAIIYFESGLTKSVTELRTIYQNHNL